MRCSCPPCGQTSTVFGSGAPSLTPSPKSSSSRNGPTTRLSISAGWRTTSASHLLKKLSVRTTLRPPPPIAAPMPLGPVRAGLYVLVDTLAVLSPAVGGNGRAGRALRAVRDDREEHL